MSLQDHKDEEVSEFQRPSKMPLTSVTQTFVMFHAKGEANACASRGMYVCTCPRRRDLWKKASLSAPTVSHWSGSERGMDGV